LTRAAWREVRGPSAPNRRPWGADTRLRRRPRTLSLRPRIAAGTTAERTWPEWRSGRRLGDNRVWRRREPQSRAACVGRVRNATCITICACACEERRERARAVQSRCASLRTPLIVPASARRPPRLSYSTSRFTRSTNARGSLEAVVGTVLEAESEEHVFGGAGPRRGAARGRTARVGCGWMRRANERPERARADDVMVLSRQAQRVEGRGYAQLSSVSRSA
jgi:hypothetical protein